MSLPVIDPNARFTCGGCSQCCCQPWAILIEQDKIPAIERHGFDRYPQLKNHRWFEASTDIDPRYRVIPKQAGTTRCLFLDRDGLCIIHKELGAQAKPIACQKFPFHVSHTPQDDRVALSFGCPSAQQNVGVPLVDQVEAIRATCEPGVRPSAMPTRVSLVAEVTVPFDAYEGLMERFQEVFDQNCTIWSCFAQALAIAEQQMIAAVAEKGTGTSTTSASQSAGWEITPYASPSDAPRASRMLFAGTMLRDVVPAHVTLNMSLWGRITLLPKLMALVKLSGGYDSKLLRRRLDIDRIVKHPVMGMAASAAAMLRRYLRTRLWQRHLVGNRLSVAAGLHQHILDVNAALFLARAIAEVRGITSYSEELIAESLSQVEMNMANQARYFDHPSLSFFTGMLDNLQVARDSLRMFAQEALGPRGLPVAAMGALPTASLPVSAI